MFQCMRVALPLIYRTIVFHRYKSYMIIGSKQLPHCTSYSLIMMMMNIQSGIDL